MHGSTIRNSWFELLRIAAMFFIVAGHCLQPLASPASGWGNSVGSYFLGSGLRIAVNVFIFIGAWFAVDAPFRADRLLRLYAKMLFFSIATFAVLGGGWTEGIRSFLPFWGVRYWFLTVYLALLALAPFLNRFFGLPRRTQAAVLLICGVFSCIFASYPYPRSGSMERFLAWFVYAYLLVGFVKRETRLAQSPRIGVVALLVSALCYAALVGLRWYGDASGCAALRNAASLYVHDLVTIPNAVCAFGIFLFAASRNPFRNRLVNAVAGRALGVYMLHGVFLTLLGARIRALSATPLGLAGAALVSTAVIFAACCLIDGLYAALIEPRYRKSAWYARLAKRIEALLA